LTIEYRGEIPEELRSRIGDRIFGCDACQEACPWNRQTPATAEPAFYPREGMNPVDLSELRNLDEESFRRRFRGTPIFRTKREGMMRNAIANSNVDQIESEEG
jgi:epoxyqueuosine reductase